MLIFKNSRASLYNADCLDVINELPPIDAIVTDPPYGLKFMGKDWDHGIPGVHFWQEFKRACKPGVHLLAFGGTRTFHRLTCAIEDAGWEIRDCLGWLYGSGFPKSHNIGNGFGTALKPAWEPIILARNPLDGTVADNVQRYGTGALNIDGCRVGIREKNESGWSKTGNKASKNRSMSGDNYARDAKNEAGTGRWPANIIHDGSEDVVRLFPETGKSSGGRTIRRSGGGNVGSGKASEAEWSNDDPGYGDSGSAARFFYCAKASKQDRDDDNTHPTVKPTPLMRYLCRLITPPNGTILDPFMGSGSTGKAALIESFNFIGIELNPHYASIALNRIQHALKNLNQPSLFK